MPLGNLNGNKFRITLRNIKCNKNNNLINEIKIRNAEIITYINYFGHQRFTTNGET